MRATVIYVSCAKSREIQVFSLDEESGEVGLIQSMATEYPPLPLKTDAGCSVLYAGTREEHHLLAFGINPDDGRLEALGSVSAPGPSTYVSCDHQRRVAFIASYAGDSLSVFPLDAKGVPQPVSQNVEMLPHAHAALMDTTNRWLLVPVLGADEIRVYRLDENRKLSPNSLPTFRARPGSGPRHLVFSPDNRRVYCLNELDGSIDLIDFDPTPGVLSLRKSISMMPPFFNGKPWASELRATPDGRFLYATDRRSSNIGGYSIDAGSGELSLIGHFPTETQPRGMAVSASGCWLVAAGELSSHLAVYNIDQSSGRLGIGRRHATGLGPICVECVLLP